MARAQRRPVIGFGLERRVRAGHGAAMTPSLSTPSSSPIAVVQGGDAGQTQACLAEFIARHQGGARIVGLLEMVDAGRGGRSSRVSHLRSTLDGRTYQLFQDLGQASDACSLLPQGLIEAGEAVRRQIAAECDLIVLSKFGKLEAENGSGLVPAFAAALEAGIPVLTTVSSRYTQAWEQFATPLYTVLPCEAAALDTWWSAVAPARS